MFSAAGFERTEILSPGRSGYLIRAVRVAD
jgi:hypothetical protein